jgi:hypothetical protein
VLAMGEGEAAPSAGTQLWRQRVRARRRPTPATGEGEEAPSVSTQLWQWQVRERRCPVSAVGEGRRGGTWL